LSRGRVVSTRSVKRGICQLFPAVKVVHYEVTGEFKGEPNIITGAKGWRRNGKVTDRVEIGFDWNQSETALVGAASFKNFSLHHLGNRGGGLPADPYQGSL